MKMMKAVILAGGRGTRLREETEYRPKPLVEVGGMPILWHIMKIFYHKGISNFELALGFKGHQIKDYFLNYAKFSRDLIIETNLKNEKIIFDDSKIENWRIGLNDTGIETHTGGRLYKLRHKLNQTFLCTYGDGVANVDILKLVQFHKLHGKVATVTAVHPAARFGSLTISNDGNVSSFAEKPTSNSWVNGGFFVFEPKIFDYLDESSILERQPLENLAINGELMAWKHEGFWAPMDTIRDTEYLNNLWSQNEAPWKIW